MYDLRGSWCRIFIKKENRQYFSYSQRSLILLASEYFSNIQIIPNESALKNEENTT